MALNEEIPVLSGTIRSAQRSVRLTLPSGGIRMPYKDPEARREYNRKYREDHREGLAEYDRARGNRETSEARSARRRRKREEDPEGVNAYNREYLRKRRAENPGEAAEYARNYRQAHPDRVKVSQRANSLRIVHGLTPDQWWTIFEAQDGRCCYCQRPLPDDTRLIHVDHNHSCTCGPKKTCSACRRGLACYWCNDVIGKAGDDPDRLELIAANLRRLNAESNERISAKPVQEELPINVRRLERREESA